MQRSSCQRFAEGCPIRTYQSHRQ